MSSWNIFGSGSQLGDCDSLTPFKWSILLQDTSGIVYHRSILLKPSMTLGECATRLDRWITSEWRWLGHALWIKRVHMHSKNNKCSLTMSHLQIVPIIHKPEKESKGYEWENEMTLATGTRHNINKSQQYWENITPHGDLRYKPSFPSYHGSLPATPSLLCDRPGIARPRIPSKGYSARPAMNSAQLQIIKSNGWASSVTIKPPFCWTCP